MKELSFIYFLKLYSNCLEQWSQNGPDPKTGVVIMMAGHSDHN